MEYPESREKSAELLRQVIALMGQHDAPFNPITYTVWYEYAAGLNARLREAIDRFVLTEPRLSQATSACTASTWPAWTTRPWIASAVTSSRS